MYVKYLTEEYVFLSFFFFFLVQLVLVAALRIFHPRCGIQDL